MGKHRWKGELANPIRPKVNRPLEFCRITDAAAAAAAKEGMLKLYEQAIKKERLKKLHRLMDKWGIVRSDYRSLSLKLALELDIPGFRIDVEYFNPKATPFRLEPVKLARPNKEPLDKHDFIDAAVPRRTDRGYVMVDPGSYVVPAGVASALGQDNSIAGAEIIEGWLVVQDKREGRPPAWSEERLRDLERAVEEKKKLEHSSKDIDALRLLARRPEWVPLSQSSEPSPGAKAPPSGGSKHCKTTCHWHVASQSRLVPSLTHSLSRQHSPLVYGINRRHNSYESPAR